MTQSATVGNISPQFTATAVQQELRTTFWALLFITEFSIKLYILQFLRRTFRHVNECQLNFLFRQCSMITTVLLIFIINHINYIKYYNLPLSLILLKFPLNQVTYCTCVIFPCGLLNAAKLKPVQTLSEWFYSSSVNSVRSYIHCLF